jgi:hypothetical protein
MAHGDFERNLSWQTMHSSREWNEAAFRFRQSKAGSVSRDDDIARKCNFESASQGKSIDPRYHRFGEVVPVRQPSEVSPSM